MPRQPRLDAPGLLQHVMARGIERRKIFWDDQDRQSFLERLAVILEETQTQCYAWAFIPNHFHLLLRTSLTPLSKVMRRLMTGYAVTFNKRHKRSGHLFQNRYKSIVCEEDSYLLELIRYIHLNPLRAGLVKDLKELDKYPWTGHSAIMGKRKNPLIPCPSPKNRFTPLNCSEGAPKGIQLGPEKPKKYLAEKTIEEVLLQFGDKLREARRRYRHFVKQGVEQGSRPELQGGGLVRSAGGDKRALLGRKKEERELSDERILGSGDFVERVLSDLDQFEKRKIIRKIALVELIERISAFLGIEKEALLSGNRKQRVCHARNLICFLAVKDMGYKFSDVAKSLNIHPVTAARGAEKGRKLVDKYEGIWDIVK